MLSYESMFAPDITGMMAWRESLGYNRYSYQYPLKIFDQYCLDHFPNADVIDKQIAFGFLSYIRERRKHLQDTVAIRNLAKYQRLSGKDAYVVPADYFSYPHSKIPYIMTDEELVRFFEATDQWKHRSGSPLLDYIVPVIFRLQFATGMRPQEVRLLSRQDFDFKNNTIYIAETKGHKDRVIPVSDEVMNMCEKYNRISQAIYPDTNRFFPNSNQNVYSAALLQGLFRKCWQRAGNPENLEYCTPYILRHNYATRTLMKWMEDGIDIDSKIPYLSAYMGHETFDSTYYYIHLLPERLSKMTGMGIADVLAEESL